MRLSFRLGITLALVAVSAHAAVKKHKLGTGTAPPLPTGKGGSLLPKPGTLPEKGQSNKAGAQNTSELPNRPKATDKTRFSTPTFERDTKACVQKNSLETFIQISQAHSPQASKQGGVFFLSDLRDVPQLFYLSKAGGWPEQMSFFGDGVSYFQLSPDGNKIALATQVGGDEQFDIYLLDVKTRNITPLIVARDKRVSSIAWDPSGRWFAFTSNSRNKIDMDLYRFDVESKKTELLTELSGINSVSDVSPNGKRIALTQFRSVTDSDLGVFELETKKWSIPTKELQNAYHADAFFSGNSDGLFFVSDYANGRRQIFFKSMASDSAPKMISTEDSDVEGLAISPARTAIAFLVNIDGYAKVKGYIVDAKGIKHKNLETPNISGSVPSGLSFSTAKGQKGIFFSLTSSLATPDVWMYSGSKLDQWTRSGSAQIRGDCLVNEELVHYPSFDGKSISAFLYRPQGSVGTVPFIVYAHGGPESQFRPVFSKVFQYLLQRGFGILAPNIRGSTGYGREFTLADNYKKRMDSVKDLIEGAKWLLNEHHAVAGKLGIYGGSYGGFLVLRSIEVEPELFAAASSSVGISNFVTFLENTKPYRRALREAEYGPLTDKEFLTSISPIQFVDGIKTPLLLFHGANDPRVPVAESQQMEKALKKRDVPVELKIFADEGHGNQKLQNIFEQARMIAHFFESHFENKKSP